MVVAALHGGLGPVDPTSCWATVGIAGSIVVVDAAAVVGRTVIVGTCDKEDGHMVVEMSAAS